MSRIAFESIFVQKRHPVTVPNYCTVILSEAKDLNPAKIEILRPSKLQVSLLTPQDDRGKNRHKKGVKINLNTVPKVNTLLCISVVKNTK